MKRIAVTAAALLALAGCGSSGVTDNQTHWDYTTFKVTLDDGRELFCIAAKGGISCDWETANEAVRK